MQTTRKGEPMTKKEIYEQKAGDILLPIMNTNGFELVDVEFLKEGTNWYLRAYIDKDGGITVEDCAVVSRMFSKKLDQEDFIEGSYIMEVSSPGLDRPLKKEKDYQRNMKKKIEIRTYQAIDEQKEFYGVLTAYDDNSVTIEESDGFNRKFAKTEIARIRQAFDF
jgi:ribosome maturation factor RimP